MNERILVVDNEIKIVRLARDYLERDGFRVISAGDGMTALAIARREKPDLIILDLMMPEMGGYEFLRLYGREADTPVIILTARLEENDKVLGLELGADDYITKPFSMRELAARIHAVLRRAEKAESTPEILREADLVLDRGGRVVLVQDKPVDLTPSEFELLATMMASPGRVYSRLELLDRLQGSAYQGYERTIDVHIRNLRAKIEPDPDQPRYIETLYGVGYRFAPRRIHPGEP